jgi:hypothetical protein
MGPPRLKQKRCRQATVQPPRLPSAQDTCCCWGPGGAGRIQPLLSARGADPPRKVHLWLFVLGPSPESSQLMRRYTCRATPAPGQLGTRPPALLCMFKRAARSAAAASGGAGCRRGHNAAATETHNKALAHLLLHWVVGEQHHPGCFVHVCPGWCVATWRFQVLGLEPARCFAGRRCCCWCVATAAQATIVLVPQGGPKRPPLLLLLLLSSSILVVLVQRAQEVVRAAGGGAASLCAWLIRLVSRRCRRRRRRRRCCYAARPRPCCGGIPCVCCCWCRCIARRRHSVAAGAGAPG